MKQNRLSLAIQAAIGMGLCNSPNLADATLMGPKSGRHLTELRGSSITVNTDNGGFSSGDGCSLPEAIDNANDNAQTHVDCAAGTGIDEIDFSGNLIGSSISISAPMVVTDDLTITGLGAQELVIVGNGNRILASTYGTSMTIADISLFGGSADLGGAIASDGDLTVSDVTLSNNQASQRGGAIAHFTGTLTLNRVRVLDNVSLGTGGGVYHGASASMMQMNQSTLIGNSAGTYGGGLLSSGQNAIVSQSTFDGNTADGLGGGIALTRYSMNILDSTFSSNTATSGGAVSTSSSASVLMIANSTMSGNFASAGGGGLDAPMGTVEMTNSILSNSLTLPECAVQNLATNINNLIEDGSCNNNAVALLTVDPMLGPLASNGGNTLTFLPLTGSPVIDSGDNTECTDSDQRDQPRPEDGDGDDTATCDRGSVEVTGPVIFRDGFEE